jgi:hypothetical protein
MLDTLCWFCVMTSLAFWRVGSLQNSVFHRFYRHCQKASISRLDCFLQCTVGLHQFEVRQHMTPFFHGNQIFNVVCVCVCECVCGVVFADVRACEHACVLRIKNLVHLLHVLHRSLKIAVTTLLMQKVGYL